MTTYYKAVREDGTSFHDPKFRWVPQCGPVEGIVVEHPNPCDDVGAAGYLSVATVTTDCTGMEWPCRLLEVASVEGRKVFTPDEANFPNKRSSAAWRVVRELPAHLALGPQGEHVSALLARVGDLEVDELRHIAAWDAARGAARDAASVAAWDAARALVVRDLLEQEHYDTLTRPWREMIGPIHPDDADEDAVKTSACPTARAACDTCGGAGEVERRHPQWGAASCPEPTTWVPCPDC